MISSMNHKVLKRRNNIKQPMETLTEQFGVDVKTLTATVRADWW